MGSVAGAFVLHVQQHYMRGTGERAYSAYTAQVAAAPKTCGVILSCDVVYVDGKWIDGRLLPVTCAPTLFTDITAVVKSAVADCPSGDECDVGACATDAVEYYVFDDTDVPEEDLPMSTIMGLMRDLKTCVPLTRADWRRAEHYALAICGPAACPCLENRLHMFCYDEDVHDRARAARARARTATCDDVPDYVRRAVTDVFVEV